MNDTDTSATINEGTVSEVVQDSSPAVSADNTSTAEASTHTAAAEPTKPRGLSAIIAAAEKSLTKPTEAKTEVAAQAPEQAAAPAVATDPVTGKALEPIKAPVSIPLALRSKFDTLPREYQEFLSKRETEIQNALKTSAGSKKFEQEVRQVLAPYEPIFKQHNINALQHVGGLLQLNHSLHAGNPQQRAVILAGLIQQFRPDAATLGQVLAGKAQHIPAPAAAPQKTVDELVEERLAQQKQEASQSELMQSLEKFNADPANEFLPYVKELMGQLLDSGAVSGGPGDIWKNAYEAACAIHPEVKAELARRAQAQQTAAAAPVSQAKKPVVGLKPSVGGQHAPAPKRTKGLDAAIRAAMDENA